MNKTLLEEKLKEINQIILSKYKDENDLGILTGLSGISLFQFYYSQYLDVDDHAKIGASIISQCIDKLNQGYNYPTFCSGIAGFGWVLDHLETMNFMNTESDDLLPLFDDYLQTIMVRHMENGEYDFLHEGIGYAFYFLKRYESTKSKKLKTQYKNILLEFVVLLKSLSIKNKKNEFKWESKDFEIGEPVYNLSLSHGISSIIGFLTKLYRYPDFKPHVETMLKGAIKYCLGFKNTQDSAFSFFPSWVTKAGEYDDQSRLAWCYGDLGIGLRFWYAAKALEDQKLAKEALFILKHAAGRRVFEETLVIDAGVCHGAFGNALIFNRIYKETKDICFEEAAKFWIEEGFRMAIHEDGYAGFKQWHHDKWNSEVSILEGIAGIGLVILDHLSDYDSPWVESLMIS